MLRYFGVILVVMALLVAIVPQFTTCESQGNMLTLTSGKTVPMKCSWTAKAALAVAIPLLVVGAMMPFSRKKESRINLSVLGTALGIMVLLLPLSFIGVCSSNMLCNTVMKPVLLASGGLTAGLSIIGLLSAIGFKRKTNELTQVSHT